MPHNWKWFFCPYSLWWMARIQVQKKKKRLHLFFLWLTRRNFVNFHVTLNSLTLIMTLRLELQLKMNCLFVSTDFDFTSQTGKRLLSLSLKKRHYSPNQPLLFLHSDPFSSNLCSVHQITPDWLFAGWLHHSDSHFLPQDFYKLGCLALDKIVTRSLVKKLRQRSVSLAAQRAAHCQN